MESQMIEEGTEFNNCYQTQCNAWDGELGLV